MKYIVNKEKDKIFAFGSGYYLNLFNDTIRLRTINSDSGYVIGKYSTEERAKIEFESLLPKLTNQNINIIYL